MKGTRGQYGVGGGMHQASGIRKWTGLRPSITLACTKLLAFANGMGHDTEWQKVGTCPACGKRSWRTQKGSAEGIISWWNGIIWEGREEETAPHDGDDPRPM